MIAIQVYHDLVTAKEVEGAPKRLEGGVGELTEVLKPGWIPIPRVKFTDVQPFRAGGEVKEFFSSRTRVPHGVRGHKRKAQMSDQQRDKILLFERQTGLKILDRIPQGYTLVLPHARPKGSEVEISALPQFVRFRLQEELDAILLGQENEEVK